MEVNEITFETPIKDLHKYGAGVRIINVLSHIHHFRGMPGLIEPVLVGDVLDIPDLELLRLPNFGRVSLDEWKGLTARLRAGAGGRPDGVIHPGVELLLARMDSHPEEFTNDTRWARHYQQYKSHWNGTEKKLFSAKMRAIRMQAMHETLMKELLK